MSTYSRNLQSRLHCSRKKYPFPVKSSSLTCQNTLNFQSSITGLIHWARIYPSVTSRKVYPSLLEKRIQLLQYLLTTEFHLKTPILLAHTTARSNGMTSRNWERECLSLLEVSEQLERKSRWLKISWIWLRKGELCCSSPLPKHAMKSGGNDTLCPILTAIRVECTLHR